MAPQPQPVCVSCGQPLAGRFCSRCGEEVLDHHHQTVRHFITHTLAHELLELDGKIWRTLRNLVLHPGLLSCEYADGRRRPYVNPLRLLITAIILYAWLASGGVRASLMIGPLTLSIAPTATPEGMSIPETINRIDRFGLLHSLAAPREHSAEFESEAAREKFHLQLEKFSEPLSFANVFLLAMALWAIFHRSRGLFVDNAAFSMHFVAFVLLSSLLFVPIKYMESVDGAVVALMLVAVVWQFWYLTRAIRRFYGSSRLIAGLAAALIYVLNAAFLTAVQLASGALALLRLPAH